MHSWFGTFYKLIHKEVKHSLLFNWNENVSFSLDHSKWKNNVHNDNIKRHIAKGKQSLIIKLSYYFK